VSALIHGLARFAPLFAVLAAFLFGLYLNQSGSPETLERVRTVEFRMALSLAALAVSLYVAS
jgi:hypothetical protein